MYAVFSAHWDGYAGIGIVHISLYTAVAVLTDTSREEERAHIHAMFQETHMTTHAVTMAFVSSLSDCGWNQPAIH
jgi:hypothetical protein